jgi:hypothetical protein
MPGSAFWLMPRAVCHMAASGLCLSREQECMRIDPDPTRPGLYTCRHQTPAWALIKARVCSVLEPWNPTVGGPDPIRGGSGSHSRSLVRTRGCPGPNLEVRTVYPGVRHFPMGAGLTVDALEYITFSGALDPPMWWG